MGARSQNELIPWTDFLMSADPALPYLDLFKGLAELAFVALGGNDIDMVLDQARMAVDTWTADQQRGPSRPDEKDERRPMSHREAGSARTAIAKQSEARRRLYERGCEVVARLFLDVLKRQAFDRRKATEIEADAPPPLPADPALMEVIKARAPNFMVMGDPRARHFGGDRFNPEQEAELAAMRIREREMRVHMMQMGAGPQHGMSQASQWGSQEPPTVTSGPREPRDAEVTMFCLALVEGHDSAVYDMPEESLPKLKELQKWFAGHDVSNTPRALLATIVRRKFDQAFEPGLLKQAAQQSIARLSAQPV